MIDIQSTAAEIRRGKKEDRKKPQGKNIMSASATQGGHKNGHLLLTTPLWGYCIMSSLVLIMTSLYAKHEMQSFTISNTGLELGNLTNNNTHHG